MKNPIKDDLGVPPFKETPIHYMGYMPGIVGGIFFGNKLPLCTLSKITHQFPCDTVDGQNPVQILLFKYCLVMYIKYNIYIIYYMYTLV